MLAAKATATGKNNKSSPRTLKNAANPKSQDVRILWKGANSFLEIPLVCGDGALPGLAPLRLRVLCGQRIGTLKFRLQVLEDVGHGSRSTLLNPGFHYDNSGDFF